jgi:hypothetical protein
MEKACFSRLSVSVAIVNETLRILRFIKMQPYAARSYATITGLIEKPVINGLPDQARQGSNYQIIKPLNIK